MPPPEALSDKEGELQVNVEEEEDIETVGKEFTTIVVVAVLLLIQPAALVPVKL